MWRNRGYIETRTNEQLNSFGKPNEQSEDSLQLSHGEKLKANANSYFKLKFRN
jgi:hypothetical protein